MADRFNRRYLLLGTHLVFMLTSTLNGVLTTLHIITVWQIMVIALINGIVSSISFPAWQTFVSDLVPQSQLKQGIALNSVQFNLSRVIGPALGGISIGVFGLAGSYYIRAASFIAILLSLLVISSSQHKTEAKQESMWKQVNEGLIYVKRSPSLQLLMLMVFLIVFLVFPYATLLPLFAGNIYHVGAKGLGLLDGSAGIGALCGSLVIVMLTQRMKDGKRVLAIACALAGLACLLFGVMPNALTAMPMLMGLGATTVIAMASSNTTIQTMVPDAIRGRIISIWVLIGSGLGPFGNLVAGWLAQAIGAQKTLFINGLLCTACAVVILALRVRTSRRAEIQRQLARQVQGQAIAVK